MSRPDFTHKRDVENASSSTLRGICNRFGVTDAGNKEALRARIFAKMAEKTVDDFSARPTDELRSAIPVPNDHCERNDPNVITTSTTKKNLASINDPIVRGVGDIHGKSDRPDADFNQLPLPAPTAPSSQPARSWHTDRSVMERTVGQRAPPTPPLALPTAAMPPRPAPPSPRASPGVSVDVSAPLSSGAILQDWLSSRRQLTPAEYDACVQALRGSVKDGVSQRRPPMRVPVAAGSFGVSMVPSAAGRRVPVKPSASAQLPPQVVSNALRNPAPLTPGVRSSTGIPSNRYANAAEVMQPQPRNEASRTEAVPGNPQVPQMQSSMPNDTTSEMKGASDGNHRRQQQTAQSLPISMPPSHENREGAVPPPPLPNRFAGAAGGPGDGNIDHPAAPDQEKKGEVSGLEWMNKFLSERFKDRPLNPNAKYGDMVTPQQVLQHFNEYKRPKNASLPPATVVARNEKRYSWPKKEPKFPPLPRDILKRMKAERERKTLEKRWEERLRGLDIEQRKKVRLAMWQNKPVESILGGELIDFRESVKKEPTLFERMRAKLAEPPKSPPLSKKAKRALAFLKALRDDNRNVQRSRVRKPESAPSIPPSMKRQRISGGFFGTMAPLPGTATGEQPAIQDDNYERPLDELVCARIYKQKRLEQKQKELENKEFEAQNLITPCKIDFSAKPDTLKTSYVASKEGEKASAVLPTSRSSGPQDSPFKGLPSAKLNEAKSTKSISPADRPIHAVQGSKPAQAPFRLGFNNGVDGVKSFTLSKTSKETAVPQVAENLDKSMNSVEKLTASEGANRPGMFASLPSDSRKAHGSNKNNHEDLFTAPAGPVSNQTFGFKPGNQSSDAKVGQLWKQPLSKPSQANDAGMGEKDEVKNPVRSQIGQAVDEAKLNSKKDAEVEMAEVEKKNEDLFKPAFMKNEESQTKQSFTDPNSKANQTLNTSDNAKHRVETHNPNGKHPFTLFPLSSAPASANPPSRSTFSLGLDSGKKVMDGTGITGTGRVPFGQTGTDQKNQESGKDTMKGMETETGTGFKLGMASMPTADDILPSRTTETDQDQGAGTDFRTRSGTGLHQRMAISHGTGTAVDSETKTEESWKETGTKPAVEIAQNYHTRSDKGSQLEHATEFRKSTIVGSGERTESKSDIKEVSSPQTKSNMNVGAEFKSRVETHVQSSTELQGTETALDTARQGFSLTRNNGENVRERATLFGTLEQPKPTGVQGKVEGDVPQKPSSGFPQFSIPKASDSGFGNAVQSRAETEPSSKTEATLVFGVKRDESKEEENLKMKSRADVSKSMFSSGQNELLNSAAGTSFPTAKSTPFSFGTVTSSAQTDKVSFGGKSIFGFTEPGSNGKSGQDAMAINNSLLASKDSKPVFSTEKQATQAAPIIPATESKGSLFGSVAPTTPSAPFSFGKPDGVAEKPPVGPFGDAKFNRGFQLGSASSFVFGTEKPPQQAPVSSAFGGAPVSSATGGSSLKPDSQQSNPFAKPPSIPSSFPAAPSGFGAAGQGPGFFIPGSSGALGTSSAPGSQSAFATPGFGTSGTPGFGQSGTKPAFSFGASGAANSGSAFGGPVGLSASNPFGAQGTTPSVFGSTPFNAPEPQRFGATQSNPFASGNPFGGSGAQPGPGTGRNETTGSGQGGNAFGALGGPPGSGAGAPPGAGAGASVGAFAMGTAPRRKLKARRMLR